jgi:hypothetical protein
VSEPEPLKFLGSYAYFSTTDLAALTAKTDCGMLFGDCGAHSARTLGITLDLGGYAAWCARWDKQLTVYANMDVIGAPQATWNNQQTLEREHGLTPLPVFHTSAPWSWLHRYLDAGYTYIALGKLLGNPARELMRWLDRAFAIAGGRAVFHGFGMTIWSALREFPFYSVDSTSWMQSFQHGRLPLLTDAGKFILVDLRNPENVLRHRELIRAHGADPAAVLGRGGASRAHIAATGVNAYRRAEQQCRARHGPITIPPGPRNPVTRDATRRATPGLHLYLAASSAGGMMQATEAMQASLST